METFIQDTDYNKTIRNQVLSIVTQADPDTRLDAELTAQEEIESYLRVRYNVGALFSLNQEVDDRKKIIVMYTVDIALYHLHSNITPDNIPEIRYLRYNRAIEWLKKVADGKLSPDLPLIETTEDDEFPNGGSQTFYGGSNDKYSERY